MVRKLCIRSLRRGVGSMDYMHGLLIAEDDLDGDDEESTNLAPSSIAAEFTPTATAAASPEPGPTSDGSSPSWSKCGVCTFMPQDVENRCCGQWRCITTYISMLWYYRVCTKTVSILPIISHTICSDWMFKIFFTWTLLQCTAGVCSWAFALCFEYITSGWYYKKTQSYVLSLCWWHWALYGLFKLARKWWSSLLSKIQYWNVCSGNQ